MALAQETPPEPQFYRGVVEPPDRPVLLQEPSGRAAAKTPGTIAIWSIPPSGSTAAIGDTGDANAPGNLTVQGNLNVLGTANSVPGLGGSGPTTTGAVPVENWGVSTTGDPATNAIRIVQALTESSNTGVAVYLTGRYPTTSITMTGCPVLVGSGPRSGLVYNTAVPTGSYGLSIICPIPTPRNQIYPPSMIRLSNFGMWTFVDGGGAAIYLQINYNAGTHPSGPNWMSVFVDHLFIGGDNTCGTPVSGTDECMGTITKPHYWSSGITGLNLPQARFTNNIIYGTAMPIIPSTPPMKVPTRYPMEHGIKLTGGNSQNCDTPVLAQNTVIGTHYAIYNLSPTGGSRACEGWRIINNLLHRNDYNIYMDATNVGSGYQPPGVFIIGNEMESQEESIYMKKIQKIFINNNTMDIGQGYAANTDTANCMYFWFVQNFHITHNHCSNIGASGLGNTFGGPGSTGILMEGASGGCGSSYCRSRFGYIGYNTCEFFEGCVHLTAWTQEIYSEMNYVPNGGNVRPDLPPTTPPSNSGRYYYRDDSENPGGTKIGWNYLSIHCGPGTANTGQHSGEWRGGYRKTACSGGTATTGIFGAPEPGAGGP